jgi:hypothetical protein
MKNILIETLRELFISYQSQFYNENEMYALIAQSDQNRAIRTGGYDDYIIENFTIKNCGLTKKEKGL